MTANDKEDHKCSAKNNNKKMEDLRMRTLDCLRGRLLAERQASKSAQQHAQFMSNKLIELEDQLRQETKLRLKADKKLKLLTKKLQSLQLISSISPTLSSDQIISGFSSGSSKSQLYDDDELHQHSSSSSSSSSSYSSSYSSTTPKITDCEDSNAGSQSGSSISEEGVEKEMDKDDSLALVAVSLGNTSTTSTHDELMTINKNVNEVLEALKDAREKILQTSSVVQ